MKTRELRQKFLDFFEKKGHKIVPSSSLIPKDPSVLLTSAGMQQFKEYFLGEPSPYGKKVASSQKCFRTSDIEEVGDVSHLTFLEMLGNFSFGNYFKEEAIKLAYEFLFKKLKLPLKEARFTVFGGDKEVPLDEESILIWKKLGIPEEKIKKCGREDNFWGPTGVEGPCGPTTEIHFGGVEVWNIVFNEYYCDSKKKLKPLKQKGVDTGMGLERLAMVSQEKTSVFEIDLFEPIIKEIEKSSAKIYDKNSKDYRIIADHIRGAVFLISEGIFPSNVERGYVLRKILRRTIRSRRLLELQTNFLFSLAGKVIETYKDIYPELSSRQADILTVIQKEEEKFRRAIEQGIKEWKILSKILSKAGRGYITGKEAFSLYETHSISLESIEELAKESGIKIKDKEGFKKAFKKHQEVSRAGAEKKFGGLGKGATLKAVKLHTATHLLHQALREVLGDDVKQMGSDINPQRLRFDFSHHQKMTEAEIKKVEDSVNEKIKKDLAVKKEEMPYEKALKSKALAFFKEKYPEKVTVYSIGGFSKEICAGPHVKKTSELGRFKIIKEESSGAGVRRIRAILE
ncbi:MAG: alanine--tRNA ligase [Parcubacteria group bacterium]|nr:alanine--tRNA ligase [Parcubacteria group bacterium]|tara:strand:+ start:20175 stop:21887 length:1713 start_codon:yes stop_codon:yes gene_type:complete